MWQVRPVVETGYENLLLVRLLLEMRMPSIRKSSVSGYEIRFTLFFIQASALIRITHSGTHRC